MEYCKTLKKKAILLFATCTELKKSLNGTSTHSHSHFERHKTTKETETASVDGGMIESELQAGAENVKIILKGYRGMRLGQEEE